MNDWGKFLLAGTCLICSCTAEPVVDITDNGTTVIYGVFANDAESRTQMVPSGTEGTYKVRWEENDRIHVNGFVSEKTEINPDTQKAKFTFSSNDIPLPYFGVYQGNVTPSYSNGTYTVDLPQAQSLVGDDMFDPNSALMFGYAEDSGDMTFRHAMSYLRIILNNDSGAQRTAWIKVEGRSGEGLSGKFQASCADGKWNMSRTEGHGTEVTLDCGSAGADYGTRLIIAIPAGTYSNGLKLTVRDKGTHFQTKTAANEFVAEPGCIYDMRFAYKPNGTVIEGGIDGGFSAETVSITDFEDLNAGTAAMNSHKDEWGRSNLQMDYRASINIGAETGAISPTYSRIRTLKDGTYILTWQTASESNGNGKDTFYALSKDLRTWEYMGYLWKSKSVTNAAGNSDTRLYSNANTLQLSNGELLATAAFRASKTYNHQEYRRDHGIIIKKSNDGGRTWYGEKEIYNGPCWEPHLIELSDGEIQCFFSESRPWISSSHSGTVMVCSKDWGTTWSPSLGQDAYRVMRRQWWNAYPKANGVIGDAMYCYTYQMPVGIVLNGTRKFAFAMENAVERHRNSDGTIWDEFEVSIVYSQDNGQWVYMNEGEVTPESQRKDGVAAGAAPYLVQFPSGETLLAYGKDGQQKLHFGNATASEFGNAFDGLQAYGSWGALDLSGSHSVLSCMRDAADESNVTIALARYNLNHSITATGRTVTVDSDNSEWEATDEALFIGSKCQAQATLRCSKDSQNYYFLMEVKDEQLSEKDKAYLMLTPSTLGTSSRRIEFNHKGAVTTKRYSSGWAAYDFATNVAVASEGIEGSNAAVDKGFIAEISIPRSVISASGGKLKVNFGYYDAAAGVTDLMTSDTSVNGWLDIKGL